MANEAFFPIPAFYFTVSIEDASDVDAKFQEVSGLEAEMETEEVLVGGRNKQKFRLPVRTFYKNIVLKRGLMAEDSDLSHWLRSLLLEHSSMDQKIDKRSININLLGRNGDELRSWNLENAWPVKWSLSNLQSQENALAIETIELAFEDLKETDT
jgi:phage tail-like protein